MDLFSLCSTQSFKDQIPAYGSVLLWILIALSIQGKNIDNVKFIMELFKTRIKRDKHQFRSHSINHGFMATSNCTLIAGLPWNKGLISGHKQSRTNWLMLE